MPYDRARHHGHPTWETVLRIYHELDDKAVNLPNIMIVASASNIPKCIIQAPNDDSSSMGIGFQVWTKCHLMNTVNDVHYISQPEPETNK